MGSFNSDRSSSRMKFFAFLASVAVVSARHIKIDEIDYGFCEGAAQPGTIDKVEVTPFPISLHTGDSLTILAQLTLNEIVPQGAMVSLDIMKEGTLPLPIPCLEITNEEGELLHIGSCETNLQKWCILPKDSKLNISSLP